MVALSLCFFSCTTEKKATNWMILHPKELSKLCASTFKPLPQTHSTDTIHYETTVTVQGDSIECPPVVPGKVYVPFKVKCPDVTYKKDSIVIIDSVFVPDTYQIQTLNYTIADLNKDKEELDKTIKKQTHWLIIVSALFLGLLLLLVLKR